MRILYLGENLHSFLSTTRTVSFPIEDSSMLKGHSLRGMVIVGWYWSVLFERKEMISITVTQYIPLVLSPVGHQDVLYYNVTTRFLEGLC